MALAGVVGGGQVSAKEVQTILTKGANPKGVVQLIGVNLTRVNIIHLAAFNKDISILKLLIKKGAQVNVKAGFEGLTPLDISILTGNTEGQKYLESIGAQKTIGDPQEFISKIKKEYGVDEAMLNDFKTPLGIMAAGIISSFMLLGARLSDKSQVGGIDMSVLGFNRIDGAGLKIEFNFDPAMLQELQSGNFNGFQAVITNVTPLPSVLPLLGLAPVKDSAVYEKIGLGPIDRHSAMSGISFDA
ncbi:MAG: hypothetical protein HQL26_08655 [Candidatus Omnitrophica bacterium]|nr:hypothetical protein [Candidatus Omnitrophota bacterium]